MHNVDSWTSNNDETCTADGTKYGFCTRCGKKVTETNTGSMHAHTMEHYETVPATCMTQGNVEYWHCSECNKNYASATGGETFNTVITDKNPDNHTGEIVWIKTATIHSSAYSCCNARVVSEKHTNGKTAYALNAAMSVSTTAALPPAQIRRSAASAARNTGK